MTDPVAAEMGGVWMDRIEFGVVGAGWRADFYLRIASAMPELFGVTGMVVRNAEKRQRYQENWPVYADIESMLEATSPLFVVTSVPWKANPEIIRKLVGGNIPVLSETPPAPDLDALNELITYVEKHKGRVQVAEQYFLQPHHAARLTVAQSGIVGKVSQAQVSSAHGYHGISLIRKFLGVGFADVRITSRVFSSPLVGGSDRSGPPKREEINISAQRFLWLDYADKLGILDFTSDQYFSWIRSHRLLVRGERGEIVGNRVSYLKDFLSPIHCELTRQEAGPEGNLEGFHLKGLQLGDEMIYRNPLAPAPLSDDEIAVGSCLLGMAEYVNNGDEFNPLAEACQDHYLNLLGQMAQESGGEVKSENQAWTS